MPRIFISYRRDDTQEESKVIYESLAGIFGERNVFRDLDIIEYGANFYAKIEDFLISKPAPIVLVIIGEKWLNYIQKRRDDPNDFVRLELEIAFRHNRTIIPVIIGKAEIPKEDQLPAKIRQLPDLNICFVQKTSPSEINISDLIRQLQSLDASDTYRNTFLYRLRKLLYKNVTLILFLVILSLMLLLFINSLTNQKLDSSTPTPTIFLTRSTATSTTDRLIPTEETPQTQTTRTDFPFPTVSSSPTLQPTRTSTYTLTPTPSITPSAQPISLPPLAVINSNGNVNIRSGPGKKYGIVGAVVSSESVLVIGEDTTGQWKNIQLLNGFEGWIQYNFLTIVGTLTPIPTNTPLPTIDPTITSAISQNITSNSQWKPIIRKINDVEMALVPKGCFKIGSDVKTDNASPKNTICFTNPFWIDRTEVTNKQFLTFGGYAAQAIYFKGDNRPREGVTWFEARNFCVKRGSRLPTEAEWEYATRGPDELIYPWGNYGQIFANYNSKETTEVNLYPEGVSWVGAVDLIGNVEEWVNSLYLPYPYNSTDGREDSKILDLPRVVRGGSWSFYSPDNIQLQSFYRHGFVPDDKTVATGFRCAKDYTT